jgi:hypothetical protein
VRLLDVYNERPVRVSAKVLVPVKEHPKVMNGKPLLVQHTDKKENLIFLIYKEIQTGAVAKSYVTNSLLKL